MDFPAPFQAVLNDWTARGITIVNAGWTTPLKRHLGVHVTYRNVPATPNWP